MNPDKFEKVELNDKHRDWVLEQIEEYCETEEFLGQLCHVLKGKIPWELFLYIYKPNYSNGKEPCLKNRLLSIYPEQKYEIDKMFCELREFVNDLVDGAYM